MAEAEDDEDEGAWWAHDAGMAEATEKEEEEEEDGEEENEEKEEKLEQAVEDKDRPGPPTHLVSFPCRPPPTTFPYHSAIPLLSFWNCANITDLELGRRPH